MSRRSALWLAVLGSFVVYLVPVAGVHGGVGIGFALLGAFYGGWDLWLLVVTLVALVLQAGAALVLLWLFREPGWRKLLAFVAFVPVFFLTVQVAYLWFVPVLLLVEADRAPEVGEANVLCAVEHAWLAPVRSGTALRMEAAGEAWIVTAEDRAFGLLTMPGCRVSELPGTQAGGAYALVAPGGHIVFQPDDATGVRRGFFHMRPGLERPLALTPPPGVEHWLPVLSDEGSAVGWFGRHEDDEGALKWRMTHRDLTTGAERSVVLDQPRNAQLTLLSFRDDGGEYVVYRYRNDLLVFDGDGRVVDGPVRPEGTQSFRFNLRRFGGGWVAWDSYREGRERSRIVWNLPAGSGVHEVPLGRSIESVAVDPSGTLIAISTSRKVSVGNIEDAVFVLRTGDGTEVYRRRRPAYSRTQLAFLGSGVLALSPGFSTGGGIEVLRLGGP